LPSALFRSLGGSSQLLAPITGPCPGGADSTIANASGFEDADGNLVKDNATCMDWNDFTPTWSGPGTTPPQTGAASNNGFNFVGATDLVNSTSDNIYAGGVKQDTVCPGTVTGKANDKADLAAIYVAAKRVNGEVYLFLSWERQIDTTTQSDVFISFEFNQSKVSCGAGSPFVQRTIGDVLFDYNFQSGNSTITAEQWDGSTWQPVGPPPFEASVNAGTVTDSIRPDSPVDLTKFEFGEAGIDLSALSLDGNGGKACETFGGVLGGSRTSKSGDTAQLKDFVGPAPIDISNCVQPTVTTALQNHADNSSIANGSSIPFGSTVHDTATLGDLVTGEIPTGQVQYTFFSNVNCSGTGTSAGLVTLNNGSVPNSNPEGPLAAGDYSFDAQYLSGNDPNYSDSEVSGCEPFHVKTAPTISTLLSSSSVSVGDSVHDSATLHSATADAGGTVTYTAYSNSSCTQNPRDAGTVTVTNGVVPDSNSLQFNTAGTFYWQASYSGDGKNASATSTCTDETLVVKAPNLTITKTPDHQAPVNAGQSVGFTITVSNGAQAGSATGVAITDNLPGGTPGPVHWVIDAGNTTASACAITGADGSQALACGPDTLAAGANVKVHVTALTSATACGTYNNTAHFSATNDGTGQASATEACNPPNLTITKTPDHQAPVNAGQSVGFTITVSNGAQAGSATGVAITDNLPGGTGTPNPVHWTIDAGNTTATGCAITGADGSQALACGPDTLAAGANVKVHVTATTSANACGLYNNTAHFSATNDGSGQASASESCNPPGLTITKTADHQAAVNAGDQIGFTITVSNGAQAGTATGVAITDNLPGGTGTPNPVHWTVDAGNTTATGCAITGADGSQALACGPDTLIAGSSVKVHVTAQTSANACGLYNNTAHFSATNAGTGQASASESCNPPNLTITKTADHQAPVNAGQSIGFTITVSNGAQAGTATGVTITDNLPGGTGTPNPVHWTIDAGNTTATGCAITGADGSQALACGPDTLAAGANVKVHVTATTSANACGLYNNTAHFSATNDGTGQASASESCNPPNLTITKTADHQAAVNAGDQIGFTITVSNGAQAGTATGVAITDNLPGGTGTPNPVHWTVDAGNTTATGCAITGADGSQALACGPDTLTAGSSIKVHVTATTSANACGTYDNTAHFSATNDGSGQDSASEACNPPDLTISKTADHQAAVNAGDQIGFTITVSNGAEAGTATGVAITDDLPGGTGTPNPVHWTVDAGNTTATGCAITGADGSQALACGPDTLAPGANVKVHVTATTSADACGVYDNTAHFTSTNDGSGQDSASEACNPPDLTISKTADHQAAVNAGDQIGFTITVSNDPEAGTATGVTITDALPGGTGTPNPVHWVVDAAGTTATGCAITGADGSQALACGPDTVDPDNSIKVHVTALTSASACGTYDNTAHFSASNDGTGQDSATEACNPAAIHIVKTADAAKVNVGSPIGFTLTVSNAGSGAAHGVTLSDTLPTNAGLSWSIASQGAGWNNTCAIAAGKLTCGPVTVPAGTTQAASTFTVHITSPTTGATGGDCPNTGVVNNTGNVTTTNDGSDQSSASTCVQALVDLAITKSGSPATQILGTGNITWTMVVTNNGPSTATGVKISDPMPAGNTFVSASSTQGTCTGGAILNCDIGTMAAGASVTITLVTTPSSSGTQTNISVVSGSRPETNLANNTATATVEITAPFVPPPCVAVSRITPGQLIVGRKTTLTVFLKQGSKAAAGFRVRIKGAGLNVVTKRSDSKGVIKRVVKMKKKGVLVFTPLGGPAGSCGGKRIGVRGVFTPPVTG
jgi:uncharacterized repeat protein (TIGR01451 family)/fimbrial isopeptide formation D2 family protein